MFRGNPLHIMLVMSSKKVQGDRGVSRIFHQGQIPCLVGAKIFSSETKSRSEKNNQSRGQKSCLSALSTQEGTQNILS